MCTTDSTTRSSRAEDPSNRVRDRLDALLVRKIRAAEDTGDDKTAGRLRLDRLANALTGFVGSDDETRAKARRQSKEWRARQRRDTAIDEAVHRYEAAMAALDGEG